EEHMISAKCAGGLFLRNFDISRRLQQAVEATGGCRGFGQEQVQPIELSQVSNPIRFEDGFASRDRQSMERSHRPLCVLLQIVEVRGVETIGDSIKNAQMKLKGFLYLVKNAAHAGGTCVPGNLFGFPVAQEVNVQLWPKLFQCLCQCHTELP